jgi:hypothetical protein
MTTIGTVVWHKRKVDTADGHACVVNSVENASEEQLLRSVLDELECGIDAQEATIENLFGGTVVGASTKFLENLFEKIVRYGVGGVLPEGNIGLDTYMAEQFLINSRANGEFLTGVMPTYCEHVFNLAHTRSKIDAEKGINVFEYVETDWVQFPYYDYLTIEELALLANMQEQSVRNEIYQGKSCLDTVTLEEHGSRIFIPVGLASQWLQTKSGYKPSMSLKVEEHQVRVPVASDGTHFGPACKMNKGFRIGEKGTEKYIENIEEALSEIMQMRTPKWRRPNSAGNFGIVSGRTFMEIDRSTWKSEK